MSCVFDNPEFAVGQCIFEAPEFAGVLGITSDDPIILANPEYAPGECIFGDPFGSIGQQRPIVQGGGGGLGPIRKGRSLPISLPRRREEEEIMAVIAAFLEVQNYEA